MYQTPPKIADRFRSFLPIVIDVETAGFNSETDAVLEIAAVIVHMDEEGRLYRGKTHACHVAPFPGANLEQSSLTFTGIDPYHPFREALDEKPALEKIFEPIRQEVKANDCTRAIMVAHNPLFDLGFIKAAVKRTKVKSPFHDFSTFDTVTLSALAYGQTVLARAAQSADMDWDNEQAHSAIYDAEKTADLFCKIVNTWHDLQPF